MCKISYAFIYVLNVFKFTLMHKTGLDKKYVNSKVRQSNYWKKSIRMKLDKTGILVSVVIITRTYVYFLTCSHSFESMHKWLCLRALREVGLTCLLLHCKKYRDIKTFITDHLKMKLPTITIYNNTQIYFMAAIISGLK